MKKVTEMTIPSRKIPCIFEGGQRRLRPEPLSKWPLQHAHGTLRLLLNMPDGTCFLWVADPSSG